MNNENIKVQIHHVKSYERRNRNEYKSECNLFIESLSAVILCENMRKNSKELFHGELEFEFATFTLTGLCDTLC